VNARGLLVLSACLALASCAAPAVPADDAAVSYGGEQPPVAAEVRTPDAPPRIAAIWVSGRTFSAGDLVRIRVTASTNVALVEMRTFGYGRALVKHDFGKFGCAYHVPVLPPFARFPYTIDFHFIARNTAGVAVSDDAKIDVR